MRTAVRLAAAASLLATLGAPGAGTAQELCQGFGPQTPRDISVRSGRNARVFTLAPPASRMNLCNIHTHTNAEHKGPDFSFWAGEGENGGYRCNDTVTLTREELTPFHGNGHGMVMPASHGGVDGGAHAGGPFAGVQPGDTIEVHWVHTSCDVAPGPGLGACLSDACANPELRVEAQVFLVVNDRNALNFNDFAYRGNMVGGLHQARSLPTGTGTPVEFAGSTTGPKYTERQCSPLQVTWSVRPMCAKLDIASLMEWAENDTVFEEHHSHGVRQLVTAPELLAPIN